MTGNLSQADIDTLLDALTNRMLNRPELTQRLRGPQGDQGPPGQAAGAQVWPIEEFGLFEPNLQVDDRNPPGDVITVDHAIDLLIRVTFPTTLSSSYLLHTHGSSSPAKAPATPASSSSRTRQPNAPRASRRNTILSNEILWPNSITYVCLHTYIRAVFLLHPTIT